MPPPQAEAVLSEKVLLAMLLIVPPLSWLPVKMPPPVLDAELPEKVLLLTAREPAL